MSWVLSCGGTKGKKDYRYHGVVDFLGCGGKRKEDLELLAEVVMQRRENCIKVLVLGVGKETQRDIDGVDSGYSGDVGVVVMWRGDSGRVKVCVSF